DETATAYLHRVYRHIKRARFGSSGNSRLRRIAKRTAAPIYWHVHPIVQAASEVRSSYSLIKSSYGIGLLRQIAGSIAFSTSFRVPPISYFDYRLFLRERWPLRSQYLYPDEFWVLLEWLSEELGPRDAFDLNDKRCFHDRVSRVGLPTIP